jgi:threonine dehydratase
LEKSDVKKQNVNTQDIEAAAARLLGFATRTPLLRSEVLDATTGAQIWLKPEVLQITGSFKFRGAYNRLSAMSAQERKNGVVAFSSGNHAQGVAAAAHMLGMPAVIVMPSDAPKLKIDRTRGFGAEIIFYDRATQSREAISEKIAAERSAIVVPSFNDEYIIAGQGTAGLEIATDLRARNIIPDIFLVCCGGGGLAAGCALALRAHFPNVEIVIVEPENYDDITRSLLAGEILGINGFAPTLCDALQTSKTDPLPFDILRSVGARGVSVSEAQVRAAVRFAFTELKLVVEPGGAVALAAALSGAVSIKGKNIAVMLSGGNVDADVFAKCLV